MSKYLFKITIKCFTSLSKRRRLNFSIYRRIQRENILWSSINQLHYISENESVISKTLLKSINIFRCGRKYISYRKWAFCIVYYGTLTRNICWHLPHFDEPLSKIVISRSWPSEIISALPQTYHKYYQFNCTKRRTKRHIRRSIQRMLHGETR